MLLIIITQALLICVTLKSIFKVAWFSLILFLIFIGGLIILFIYIIRLASNNDLTIKKNKILLVTFITTFIILNFYPNFFAPEISISYPTPRNLINFINKMFSLTSRISIPIIILYLLLVLLITVRMVLLKRGPLRSFRKIK